MSIAEIFENGERKQDKSHFRNLVVIAHSDGELSVKEEELLQDIGSDLGLTNEQLNDIKNNLDKYPVHPPANKTERFEQIVDLIQMVQVDGNVGVDETKVLEKVAVKIGYRDLNEVDVESILALIVRGEDIEVIIEELL